MRLQFSYNKGQVGKYSLERSNFHDLYNFFKMLEQEDIKTTGSDLHRTVILKLSVINFNCA